jgi:hypothetical protein
MQARGARPIMSASGDIPMPVSTAAAETGSAAVAAAHKTTVQVAVSPAVPVASADDNLDTLGHAHAFAAHTPDDFEV